MRKVNVIIPCCGEGQRFIRAGYQDYKAGMDFMGKPILHHVMDAFPDDFIKWIITDTHHLVQIEKLTGKYQNVHLIVIEPHKNGPAWSINEACLQIPEHQQCFVAYNDVFWKWDIEEVMEFVKINRAEGIVFTHTGFHPHLFKNNFSAFCRTDGQTLIEIKEKSSFTDNWMKEPLSTGVYYFSDTCVMLSKIKWMIDNGQKVAGEYYPSLIFNEMKHDGLNVCVFETRPFVHLGTPEQYEDALHWQQIFVDSNDTHSVPVLIMMCGTGNRMKIVSEINKAGIEVHSQPMFRYVSDRINSSQTCYLVNNATLDFTGEMDEIINIHNQTSTQVESLFEALPYLREFKRILVNSNDCYGIFDTRRLDDFNDFDIVLFGFKRRLIHTKQPSAHSGFSVSGDHVTEISIKSVSENQQGLAGMYYFPNVSILDYLNDIDCKCYESIDHFAQFLLGKKAKIGFIDLKHYVHLGTPEEYHEFSFWKKFYE